MEFSIFNRFHDVFTEHKIFDVALRYHNPLAAGKADFAAAVVESFDLLIDTANGLYFSLLVDGAGNRDVLSQPEDEAVHVSFQFVNFLIYPSGQISHSL
jgi:hypothetical protein